MLTTDGFTFATRSANEAGAPGTGENADGAERWATAACGAISAIDAAQASPAAARVTGFQARFGARTGTFCELPHC